MPHSPQSVLRVRLILALALLLFIAGMPLTASAGNQQPFMADPPRMPEPPQVTIASPAAVVRAASVAQALACTGTYCAYLPFVSLPAVAPTSRQFAVDLYQKAYLGSAGVPHGWNGNIAGCNPGTTSQAFRDSVLLRINYYREMAGIPKVSALRSDYNQQDQAAALIMAANQQLNHTPPSTWKCYTQTGYDGASTSNLAMGRYGPDAISLYMIDNGVGSLGHRRWVLYPQTQEMGTGDVIGSGGWQTQTNAMKAWDSHVGDPRPTTRDGFVAWPPAAYVPYQVVYPVWSFAVAGADFSGATVTMTSNGVAIPVTVTQPVPPNGYGENTLAWTACNCSAWPNPGTDRAYQVVIHNVIVNSVSHDYSYTVTVIDPSR